METLFSTELSVNNKNVVYQVYFDNEKYVFQLQTTDNAPSSFSFKRGHDEWLEEKVIAPQLKQQAIEALENYLLAQH